MKSSGKTKSLDHAGDRERKSSSGLRSQFAQWTLFSLMVTLLIPSTSALGEAPAPVAESAESAKPLTSNQRILERARARLQRVRKAKEGGRFEEARKIAIATRRGLAKLDQKPENRQPSEIELKARQQIMQQVSNALGQMKDRPDRAKQDVIDHRRVVMARDRLKRAREAIARGDKESAQEIVRTALEGIRKVQGVPEGENPSQERQFILKAASRFENQLQNLERKLPGASSAYSTYVAGDETPARSPASEELVFNEVINPPTPVAVIETASENNQVSTAGNGSDPSAEEKSPEASQATQ